MEEKSEQNILETSGTEQKKPSVLKTIQNEMSKLAAGIKRNNALYNESIQAIHDWEQQQNEELKKIQDKIDIQYNPDVIDIECIKKKEEMKNAHKKIMEKIRNEEEEIESIQLSVDELLKRK